MNEKTTTDQKAPRIRSEFMKLKTETLVDLMDAPLVPEPLAIAVAHEIRWRAGKARADSLWNGTTDNLVRSQRLYALEVRAVDRIVELAKLVDDYEREEMRRSLLLQAKDRQWVRTWDIPMETAAEGAHCEP